MKKLISLLLVFIMITAVYTSVSASEVKKSKYVSKFMSIHQEKIKSITGNYQDNI